MAKKTNKTLPPTKAERATERLEELIGEDYMQITDYVILGNDRYSCGVSGECRKYPDGFEGLADKNFAFLNLRDNTGREAIFFYKFDYDFEED